MNHNNEIVQELEDLAPALISLQQVQVFTVPVNYFEEFGKAVMNQVGLDNHFVLPTPQSTLTVPQGFFESFADTVLQKIKTENVSAADEIRALSPALSATGNDNIFTVPQTYFRHLPEIIVSRIQEPARVVTMRPRSIFSRYAIAAVITGLLGLTTFSLFNKKADLAETNITALAMADAKNIIQTNSFDRVLETVSDEDIVGFLQSGGQDVEAALVASSIDSKELPAVVDYITNENTLNNYLESLDITYPN